MLLITAGCGAAREAYKKGTKAEVSKDYEAAMEQYRQALAQDPANIDYKLKYEQTRFTAAFDHFQHGRRALDLGDLNTGQGGVPAGGGNRSVARLRATGTCRCRQS